MLTKRTTPGLSFYAVMLAVGLLAPIAAVFGYLAIALYLIFPLALLRSRRN